MINLSRTNSNIVFTTSEKKHCKSTDSMSINLKKRIFEQSKLKRRNLIQTNNARC